MRKLYKQESATILYAEYWIEPEKQIVAIHTGKVGKTGDVDRLNFNDFSEDKEQADTFFCNKYKSQGFAEIPDAEKSEIVVQYKMKSLQGNKRDHWLKDKVTDYLNDDLAWKALGHVDAFDPPQNDSFCSIYKVKF